MKRIKLFALCTVLIFVACEQESESVYSCNKNVNEWAKLNITEIQQMSRQNWIELHDTLKLAAYRAFTPEQKHQFWKEKFQEVKSLDWSQEEIAHISKAENYLDEHSDFFSHELTDDEIDNLETFFYSWQKEGIEKFGWTNQTAISIAGTGLPISEEEKNNNIPPSKSNSNKSEDCHCNIKILSDFCNTAGFLGECISYNCEESTWGCGWIWFEDCNGICIYTHIKVG